MAKEQPSNAGCPLQNCDFKNTNGNWTCCQCGSPNTTGWCGGMLPSTRWERNALTNEWQCIQTCDHMCCRNCPRETPAPGSAPESSRKKRKDSSKRGTRDPRDGVSMTAEEAGQPTSCDIALDYSGKEKKHNKDKKSSKSRSRRH
ncbi:hypothetical protein N0V85_007212 [Neurospora sp. IMI 360204]|nr:hypothetical protein N0V85_007212 [Neurospora sp. IMI 360204]